MIILGISAYYHDSACCLIKNGEIISAIQEERLTRKKHDASFPIKSINLCLKEAKISHSEIDYVVFYDKPFLKFERLLETYFAFAPKGFKSFLSSMPIWLKEKLFQKKLIIKELKNAFGKKTVWNNKLLFSEHHLSHAASAFFSSPYDKAAILTMDGVGEWTTTSVAIGHNNKINILKEINFPHSLGLLYSAFTFFTGFKINSGEYKLMGLAPYGKPIYAQIIKDKLINIKEDGSFKLNMNYFDYCTGTTMTNNKFNKLFDGPPRKPESKLTIREMNIAASIQYVIEEIIIKIVKSIKKETQLDSLCLAGGVALNCVANGKLIKEKIFKNIWIQPASGDAGGSLGAALATYYIMLNNRRVVTKNEDNMKGSYLGPSFKNNQIEKTLSNYKAKFLKLNKSEIIDNVAKDLVKGKAIGWMQGKMEFGPRALGARSIIADPRSPKMQKLLNLKVKFRESFRPFAPSILRENLKEWFEIDQDSPYMLLVANVINEKIIKTNNEDKKLIGIDKLNITRSEIPSVTHVDYSARIQTVHRETNPMYYDLISKFNNLTGCPMVINTSFNIRGEPIVCTPEDALKCFMGTDLDILVIENFYLKKNEQKNLSFTNYKELYELD